MLRACLSKKQSVRFKIYLVIDMKRIFRHIAILIMLAWGFHASGQTYPEVILPNSSRTIESNSDTLWILKQSQLQRAIMTAQKLAIEVEISNELRKKISLMEEKEKTQDSLINILKTDRDYYMNNWKTCATDIELVLKKHSRQKLFARLAYAGIGIAFVAGFLIGK
jgi:hypothetical protein